uniref:Putative secreted protein n=1 Tax=Anopheles darlingi TaxID=43151 RepID=A0A2M4D6T5_ANODA
MTTLPLGETFLVALFVLWYRKVVGPGNIRFPRTEITFVLSFFQHSRETLLSNTIYATIEYTPLVAQIMEKTY